jgi:hypothetical protein
VRVVRGREVRGRERRGKEGRRVRRDRRKNVPSSALIENDRTEIWMTVGFVDVIEVGRLFAVRQYISLSFFQLSSPFPPHTLHIFPLGQVMGVCHPMVATMWD